MAYRWVSERGDIERVGLPGSAPGAHGTGNRIKHLLAKRAPLFLLAPLLWMPPFGPVRGADGATFTVDTTIDAVDASPGDGICATAAGACSLRAAVQEANALPGADTIDLPAGTYVLTLAGRGEDAGVTDDLDVHDTLTIAGAGAATTIIDANGRSAVIEAGVPSLVFPLPALTLSGVTLRNGYSHYNDDSCDGAVLSGYFSPAGVCANGFWLALADSVVEDNRGDGVFVLGLLTLTRSAVRNNQDPSGGGASGILLIGSAGVIDSTISGNGGLGFGVISPVVGGNAVDIRNSTISANGTTGLSLFVICEPACPAPVPVTLNNVTITGHTGPALDTGISPFYVSNSVLAGNGTECYGTLLSRGYNLLQTLTHCAVVDDTTGNIVGLPASLGPLQDNGGPTETHALLPGSPAINAANPAAPRSGGSACQPKDQRGTPRPVGGRCDMGAYESPCGDARRDPGEQCDDGNALAGDCCSPECLLEAAGSPCESDGNLCTDDICDATGACTHSIPTLCTHADPGKSHITIAGRESVAFSWMATGPVTKADFGNPRSSSTGYRLCAYDNAGGAFLLALTSAGVCDPEFGCWRETPRGFIYEQAFPGTVKVKLTAGSPARIAVDARGTSVRVSPLPLSLPLRVTFSPLEPASACWDATYSTATKNSPSLLRATSD